ncbi:MAG: hypothetical protein C4520_11990 [Candidatus Abyssobacteria bacterium SURF_5]|uniref:Galactose-1-phosphate uridylyltransferase n=1 Tax=Abyssobacteria bacterium (strain SURF_5) TaxID=2093360 RepID=A0A3A4NG80_ABYX5|nr:MAG: hypothetical protein C4520_11990 [Candidatus Abyssubacteria bacterium SURF_5]
MELYDDLFQELKNEAVLLPPQVGTPSALRGFQLQGQLVQPVWRRKDYLTDTWCHINLARAKRPFAAPQLAPSTDSTCFLCPGNEGATPRDVETSGDTLRIGDAQWSLRAFPNLYPWLIHHGNIVESPQHKLSLKDIDEEEQFLALQAIQGICQKYEEADLHPMVFKNQGWGASTAHTHWQYGALPYLPKRIEHERTRSKVFAEKWKMNVFDAILSCERDIGKRFVTEDEVFGCVAPFSPRTNYEVWLIAKEKVSSLAEASKEMLGALSKMMVRLFHVLYHHVHIDSLCAVCHQIKDEPDYRFHLEVLPFKHWAGAERGFEEYVVEVTPEDVTSFLRDHLL